MNNTYTTNPLSSLKHFHPQRGWIFGGLIILALLAFEIFNYSTTEYSLTDLLGELRFLGIRWATILSIAFCGIDFAGIARLFTPEQGADEPAEVWYLFGAWILAATMNAMLTWWGVSVAILNHPPSNSPVIDRQLMIKAVPVFVAIMVWLIRILIIGTFSVAGDHLFNQPARHGQKVRTSPARTSLSQPGVVRPLQAPTFNSATLSNATSTPRTNANSYRPAPRPNRTTESAYNRAEPTYHPIPLGSNQTDDIVRRL